LPVSRSENEQCRASSHPVLLNGLYELTPLFITTSIHNDSWFPYPNKVPDESNVIGFADFVTNLDARHAEAIARWPMRVAVVVESCVD